MTFPDLNEIIRPDHAEYEKGFIQIEYGPGLPYYLNRLDRLMFSGRYVLDAGCGVGQWSIALSRRFERVEAIDLKPSRLAVLKQVANLMGIDNIGIRQGSMEQLPYSEGSFDAIFCYGVVMFTEMEKTLAEFFRVLRPGGRVYVCLNADGWSRYLIEERGRTDPRASHAGRTTLYNTYWRRAIQNGIIPSLHEKLALLRTILRRVPPTYVLYKGIELSAARLGWRTGARKIAHVLLSHSRGGKELWDGVRQFCGEEFTSILLDDVWTILGNSPWPVRYGHTLAVQPNEFESLVAAAGFDDFQWSEETGLVCDWLRPPLAPKYPGTFDKDLSVWECLFVKAGPWYVAPSVEPHLRSARAARETSCYPGPTPSPVLSNRSRWTYPRHLFEHARFLAERLGGEAYLRTLARLLTDGARGEEDAVRRIIEFVQRAVFRDPVAQPLTETGAIPEALTALLCARGRCGHTSTILMELFKVAGMEARLRPFPNHVITEVRADRRWVLADADAFKNGVIPVNRQGRLLAMEDLVENPFQLDRFPVTGWFIRPDSLYTRDTFGRKIVGYVDAVSPDQRGYVSGYYVADAKGYPPSVPSIVRFEASEGRFHLEWTSSNVRGDRLLGYRVSVGTASRGWSYDHPGDGDEILRATANDVISVETPGTRIEGDWPPGARCLFASVTAYSSRIEKGPGTHFWPSEEAACEP